MEFIDNLILRDKQGFRRPCVTFQNIKEVTV